MHDVMRIHDVAKWIVSISNKNALQAFKEKKLLFARLQLTICYTRDYATNKIKKPGSLNVYNYLII